MPGRRHSRPAGIGLSGPLYQLKKPLFTTATTTSSQFTGQCYIGVTEAFSGLTAYQSLVGKNMALLENSFWGGLTGSGSGTGIVGPTVAQYTQAIANQSFTMTSIQPHADAGYMNGGKLVSANTANYYNVKYGDIASGQWDNQIGQLAAFYQNNFTSAQRRYMGIRLGWEFNQSAQWGIGVNYSYGFTTPYGAGGTVYNMGTTADYASAFQRVWNIFHGNTTANGVTYNIPEVAHIWCINYYFNHSGFNPGAYNISGGYGTSAWDPFFGTNTASYPGDSYVDVTMIDTYNQPSSWSTFSQVSNDSLTGMNTAHNGKPLWIETGTASSTAYSSGTITTKATWWTDALNQILNTYTYIDGCKSWNDTTSPDYNLDGGTAEDTAAAAAYAAGIASPSFVGVYSPGYYAPPALGPSNFTRNVGGTYISVGAVPKAGVGAGALAGTSLFSGIPPTTNPSRPLGSLTSMIGGFGNRNISRPVSGTVTSAGLAKQTLVTRSFTGLGQSAGRVSEAVTRALAGTDIPLGRVTRGVVGLPLLATVPSSGALAKGTTRALTSTENVTGAAPVRRSGRSLASLSPPSAILLSGVTRALAGVDRSLGKVVTGTVGLPLLGAVPPTGILAKGATRALASTGHVTGTAPVRRTGFNLSGLNPPSGVLVSGIVRALAAVMVVRLALLTRNTGFKLAGAEAPTGVVSRGMTVKTAGTVTSAGTIKRIFTYSLASTGQFIGAVTTTLTRSVAGVARFVGARPATVINRVFTSTENPAGFVLRAIPKQVAGAVVLIGATPVRLYKPTLTSVFASSGFVREAVTRSLGGTLRQSGFITTATLSRSLAGVISFSGLIREVNTRSLAGTIQSAGLLTRSFTRPLAGVVHSAGSVAVLSSVVRALSGTIQSSGVVIRSASSRVTGVVSNSGFVSSRLARALAGTSQYAGALSKLASRIVSGTARSAGSLSESGYNIKLTGVVSFIGTSDPLSRVTRILSGTVRTIGAATLRSAGFMTSVLSFIGHASSSSSGKILAGTITSQGKTQVSYTRQFSSTYSSSGSLLTALTRRLSSTIRTFGLIVPSTVSSVSGTVISVGVITRRTTRALSSSEHPLATVSRTSSVSMAGVLNFAGVVATLDTRLLRGVTRISGLIVPSSAKSVSGTVTLTGYERSTPGRLFGATASSSGKVAVTTVRLVSGTVRSSGAVVEYLSRVSLSGVVRTAGQVTQRTGIKTAGTVITSGAIAPVRGGIVAILLSATLSLTGSSLSRGASVSAAGGGPLKGTVRTSGTIVRGFFFRKTLTSTLRTLGSILGIGSKRYYRVEITDVRKQTMFEIEVK